MKAFIIYACASTFFLPSASAQSNKATKTANDATAIIQSMGKIFKKKNVSTNESPTETTFKKRKDDELRAGDVSPNAKVLEIDDATCFMKGLALVKKGTAKGLIDSSGKFIVPFNTYDFTWGTYGINTSEIIIPGTPMEFNTGCFLISNKTGFVNPKGSYIDSKVRGSVRQNLSQAEGYVINETDHGITYIDEDGKQYSFPDRHQQLNYHNGLWAFSKDINESSWGYKNIRNEIVLKPQFNEAHIFSEDLAIVGHKNEFGEMKFGVIDKMGKQIVPFIYSKAPENYYCNRSKIYPAENSDLSSAYINRTGDVVIKFTREDERKYGTFGNFSNNYAYSASGYVIDTTGKVLSNAEFFKKFGTWGTTIDRLNIYPGKILFSRLEKTEFGNGKMMMVGFIDLENNKVVEPAFLTQNIYFDSVSKLAYAERFLGKDDTGE